MKHRPFRGVVKREAQLAPTVGDPGSMERFLAPAYRFTDIPPAPTERKPDFVPTVRFPIHDAQLAELRRLAELPKAENKVAQYIIWNPISKAPPTVIHPDRPTAIRIAGRMAHENPGQTFYVCKLTNSAVKPIPVDVKYEDLDR